MTCGVEEEGSNGTHRSHDPDPRGLRDRESRLLAASAWLLLWPRSYQSVAEIFLEMVSDTTVLRVLGALGTLAGGALAWLAFELN